jgi:tRNA dimethylallyltransferase
VAVELARRLSGEILSFDSRQVFRGIEVSSSAPTPEELGGIPVHLVSHLDPSEDLTAARYVGMAREAVQPGGRPANLVFTAGTGLYLKAYLEGLDLGGMGAVPDLRETLEAEAERNLPALAQRLVDLSPELAALTDLHNPVRVVRRMELLVAAAFAEDARAASVPVPGTRIEALKVGLAVPVAVLEERIRARVDRMLASGWRQETEALLDHRPAASAQVMKSIGVAEMVAHIRGDLAEDAMREAVVVRTRQYAKRQRTWFRGDPEVKWVEAGNKTPSDIVETILGMLN